MIFSLVSFSFHFFLLNFTLLCKYFIKGSCCAIFSRYIFDGFFASFCIILDFIDNFNKFVLFLCLVVAVPEMTNFDQMIRLRCVRTYLSVAGWTGAPLPSLLFTSPGLVIRVLAAAIFSCLTLCW